MGTQISQSSSQNGNKNLLINSQGEDFRNSVEVPEDNFESYNNSPEKK